MKKHMMVIGLISLFYIFITCGATMHRSFKTQDVSVSAGENFKFGDETYALEKWIKMPKYDSESKTGYGLSFLQKEGVMPVQLSISTNGSPSAYASLLDMKLEIDGENLEPENISFENVKDVPGYTARIIFEFAIPNQSKLPDKGTLFYTNKKIQKEIDLSALEAPEKNIEISAENPEILNFCGNWKLSSIIFHTPDTGNGIFEIDATLDISDGFEYGRDLTLSKDMSLKSDVDIDALIDAISELPFIVNDFNLKGDTGWSYSDGKMKTIPDGTELMASYNEKDEVLLLVHSGKVDILSKKTDKNAVKSGPVLMEITAVFKKAN